MSGIAPSVPSSWSSTSRVSCKEAQGLREVAGEARVGRDSGLHRIPKKAACAPLTQLLRDGQHAPLASGSGFKGTRGNKLSKALTAAIEHTPDADRRNGIDRGQDHTKYYQIRESRIFLF